MATGLLVFGVLSSYLFLPKAPEISGSVQSLLFGIIFLALVPVLYVRFVLKESLSTIGFTWKTEYPGIPAVFFAVSAVLSIWFLLLQWYDLGTLYSLPPVVRTSFPWFLFYGGVLVAVIAFLYEVFFRGLVMLSWFASFGIAAVFLQFGFLLALLAISGGLLWQNVPMLLSGFASGFVAYHTRSLFYSWMTAWLSMLLADVLFLVFG